MGTTPRHEALRELFSDFAPELASLIEDAMGVPIRSIEPVSTEQTLPEVEQLLPDTVLLIPDTDAPQHVVIVEVQLAIDGRKWRKWPLYIATAARRYKCRADVVVVAPDPEVARWARRGRRYGIGMTLRPCVIGDVGLAIPDAETTARAPVRAVAAAIAHMHADGMAQTVLGVFEVLADWHGDPRGRLSDMLEAALPVELLTEIEELMRTDNFEYKSDFAKKYYAKGREEGREEFTAHGQIRALLLILEARGLVVDDEARARIEAERDCETLDRWTRLAATTSTVASLFEA